MSLKPIPARILTHNAVFRLPAADTWGYSDWTEFPVYSVALQPEHKVIIGKDAKERQCNAVMFYDCRLSRGAESLECWMEQAEQNGKELEVVCLGRTYHVLGVDWLYDDEGTPHHWEILLC